MRRDTRERRGTEVVNHVQTLGPVPKPGGLPPARAVSDSQGRRASDPTPDIIALEKAAESLTRHGDIQNAIALWAIVLRLRGEIRCPVT